ncbi:MAG: SUMF1/EgtB/PvdO family nonheme iron enzyme [candidate division Zixibacteria bacterium]|nr:SUMF1/EgtB/PvdO family nonheme iron enzyme [candidate division Zixibacteria bacterium]
MLSIKTHKNATVYLDGKELTQLNDIRLEPSRVTVEVRMPKAEPVNKRLTLKKGDTLTVDLYPDIQTGTIQVVVTPFDANIELKGDAGEYYTSTGKKIFSDVPIGEYKLIVKADKHKTYKESFTIKADEKLKKNIILIEGSDIIQNMIFVEGGTFTMGRSKGKSDNDEKPAHKVTLSSFYIGKYEVTQREWKEIMGNNPSKFKGDDLPVEKVSWYDAVEFCNNKSIKEGLTPCYIINKSKNDTNNKSDYDKLKWLVACNFDANGYRLPTEAEWEYAARGGNKSQGYKYSGSDNIKEVAWYNDNSKKKTHKVGLKRPNELGIYDMTGNVWEWCWDWYGSYSSSSATNPKGSSSGIARILRGGSWGNFDRFSRVAFRVMYNPDNTFDKLGFRVIVSFSSVKSP